MAKYWLFRMVQPNHHCKGKAEEWLISSLVTSCEELTHWKRLWFWEGLGAGGEGDNRGWDGWMASLTRWTWVSVNSRSWWWTGRPCVLWLMGSQNSDTTERLNWTEFHRTLQVRLCFRLLPSRSDAESTAPYRECSPFLSLHHVKEKAILLLIVLSTRWRQWVLAWLLIAPPGQKPQGQFDSLRWCFSEGQMF